MHSIGYANKLGKVNSLANAGADWVIQSMTELASCLRNRNHR
jgi:phosphoglycolate phosphatase-like HAD superfamily hydrolase